MFYNCNHFSSTIFFRLYNIWGNSSGYACARTSRDDSPITITAIESISFNSETDEEYCEDWDTGEELSEYTDQSTCEDAGHTWYGPNCTIEVWEKQ